MSKQERRGRRRTSTAMADPMAGLAGAGNVDKIRDILFGAQMRDYARRFTRLEEVVDRSLSDLRKDVDDRITALETFARSEMGAIDERLRAEAGARADDTRRLSRELESTERGLQTRLGELADRTSRAEQSLRQQLLDLTRSLRNELRDQHGALTENLDRAVESLDDNKVDRANLAGLFTEIALRLDDGMIDFGGDADDDVAPPEALPDVDG